MIISVAACCVQESEGGLYVSLTSLLGFSREFVELNYRKTGEQLYLLIKRTAKPKVSTHAHTSHTSFTSFFSHLKLLNLLRRNQLN